MSSYTEIPDTILTAIRNYADHHHPLGHFLTAVMSNNLMESVARADEESLAALHPICIYVYNEIPSNCWGSPEKVAAWLKAGKK